MLIICYINECPDLVSHVQGQQWVAAWQRQVSIDFADAWNISAVLHYLGDSQIEKPGPNDGIIRLVKKSSQDGALGSHWAETLQPVGEVGIQDCIDDGIAPSSCGSHETLEMILDPSASEAIQVGHLFLAKEACDRVEGSDPNYKINGVVMENFSLPAAFVDADGPWDFRHKCHSNIVLNGGYQLQVDIGTGEWTQITGKNTRNTKHKAGISSRRATRMRKAGADPASLRIVPA